MKPNEISTYIKSINATNLVDTYYELLLETDMVKYLVLKSLKLTNITLFSDFAKLVGTIDPAKRIFVDVLNFYETQNLKSQHSLQEAYPNLALYVKQTTNGKYELC